MAVDPLIELHDVNKYYGELHVLQDIDLTVGRTGGAVGRCFSVLCRPAACGQPLPEEGRALARLLDRVGLADQAPKFPAQLSGGRQLGVPPRPFRHWGSVAVARALTMEEPEALLFDEPTSGMTMVVVTPEMGFARSAANRVVFMSDGRIIEDRAPEEFFTDPHSERAQDFPSEILKH
ncbi:hypothetical protein [Streptomyces longisporus]|uniref:Amino acid ABC transporter ATP-binding protein n=1 Tax=Streptomyces longisporus TaxID=1948 RepID=A0ABN3KVE5_STRLO